MPKSSYVSEELLNSALGIDLSFAAAALWAYKAKGENCSGNLAIYSVKFTS